MTITPEEIENLRGLCRDATEGPWTIEPHGNGDAIYSGRLPNLHGLNIANVEEWDWNATANKAFIAAAREALPRLLDEIERLQGICYRTGYNDLARSRDRLKEEVERMQKEKRSDLRSVRIAVLEREVERLRGGE